MKKYLLFGWLCISTVLISCTKKPIEKTIEIIEVKEEKKVDYIEKFQIRNGLVIDSPRDVNSMREGLTYGKVEHVIYHSNTCNMDRGFNILLPASYDGSKKFPVIYFQHGIFGDEHVMLNDAENRFKELTTNLAADGVAKEVIIVFGNMYASTDPDLKPAFDEKATAPYDNYINELTNDLMPYVESHYAVLTGRENTAICGFSMGGRESIYIGLNRTDLFGYIGAIAPAPGLVPTKDWAMTHSGMYKSEADMKYADGYILPELFMVCCGTGDKTVGQYPKSYHKILEQNGIEHLWFEVMNADHNSHAIRSGFYQFMIRVFQ